MDSKLKLARAAWCLLIALNLLVACSGAPAPAANPQPVTPPVMLITQVITEIVAPTPLPVTPSPVPTSTPVPPTPTPTYDPASAPIYYPLEDCVASRLHIGDRAMVSLYGGPNGIRYGRDLFEDTVFAYAQPGQILDVVNGPWCSRGWIVWQVRLADGQVGFTPEGNGNEYWLFPAP